MEALASSIGEMFLLMLLGFFIRKRNLVSDAAVKELGNILLSVILPFSVLASGNEKCSEGILGNTLLCFLIVSLYYILALIISYLVCLRCVKKEYIPSSVNMAVFANTSFIGLPLTEILFGAEGMIYAVVYNLLYNVFMFIIGVSLFSGRKSRGERLRGMLLDPLTISSIISVVLFFSPWKLPSFLQGFLTVVGDISVPLSMMLVGAWLVGIDFCKIVKRPSSYVVCLLRLVVLPFLVRLSLLPFSLDSTMTGTVVLISAVPVGALNVILAGKYGHDTDYVNETMMLSIVLSIVTLPLVILTL